MMEKTAMGPPFGKGSGAGRERTLARNAEAVQPMGKGSGAGRERTLARNAEAVQPLGEGAEPEAGCGSAGLSERIRRLGAPVFSSEVFRRAREQTHHGRTTVAEHTLRVAAAAERIAEYLVRHHVDVDVDGVVVAALCHDLGIVGRGEKFRNNYETFRRHPGDSAIEAEKLYPDMPPGLKDAILRHMWPLCLTTPPRTREGWILLLADKIASVQDLVAGRERGKHV